MNIKITDSMIALLFLFISFESLQINLSGLYYPNVGLAFFYFVTALSILRSYSWTSYILYANSVLYLLIVILGLYKAGMEAWQIAIVPLVLAILSALYGWFRFKGAESNKPIRREVAIFVITLLSFTTLLASVDYFWGASSSLSGPVNIQRVMPN